VATPTAMIVPISDSTLIDTRVLRDLAMKRCFLNLNEQVQRIRRSA
jgi:hypothetical protein